jgi:hypothetical protein
MTTYRVEYIPRDAARPYAVCYGNNRAVGWYETKEAATRRVRYLDCLGRKIETYRLPTPVPVLTADFDE